MERGKIIVLNGVSSSGKTTLAKCIQERSDAELVWMSIDSFCHMWPEKLFNGDFTETFLKIQDIVGLTTQQFADHGISTIVDVVLLEPHHSLEKLIAALKGYSVMLVHVACPTEELRRREAERGDRDQGQGESQLPYLAPKDTYDLTVDTFHVSIEQCADEILQLFTCTDEWTAFDRLCSELS